MRKCTGVRPQPEGRKHACILNGCVGVHVLGRNSNFSTCIHSTCKKNLCKGYPASRLRCTQAQLPCTRPVSILGPSASSEGHGGRTAGQHKQRALPRQTPITAYFFNSQGSRSRRDSRRHGRQRRRFAAAPGIRTTSLRKRQLRTNPGGSARIQKCHEKHSSSLLR